jgi:hypothetical protein
LDLYGVSFVDASHGWAVGFSGTILAFVSPPPSGTLSTTPSSGPPGTVISAASVTPCPAGSTYATIYLDSSAAATVASAQAGNFDASGNWSGTVGVPVNAPAGSYFVTASCFQPGASDTQNYNFSPFSVTSTAPSTGNVNGTVFKFNFTPLARAMVSLDSGPGQVTGSSGAYTFSGVSAGSHSLAATYRGRVCHANSKTGPTSPVTVTVSSGGTTTVNWFCK